MNLDLALDVSKKVEKKLHQEKWFLLLASWKFKSLTKTFIKRMYLDIKTRAIFDLFHDSSKSVLFWFMSLKYGMYNRVHLKPINNRKVF